MQASSNREENRTVLSFMAHLSFTFSFSFPVFESIEHAEYGASRFRDVYSFFFSLFSFFCYSHNQRGTERRYYESIESVENGIASFFIFLQRSRKSRKFPSGTTRCHSLLSDWLHAESGLASVADDLCLSGRSRAGRKSM